MSQQIITDVSSFFIIIVRYVSKTTAHLAQLIEWRSSLQVTRRPTITVRFGGGYYCWVINRVERQRNKKTRPIRKKRSELSFRAKSWRQLASILAIVIRPNSYKCPHPESGELAVCGVAALEIRGICRILSFEVALRRLATILAAPILPKLYNR